MQDPRLLPPERRWTFVEDDRSWRIPTAPTLWAVGGFALLLAVGAWVPPIAWLAWVDLPIVFLLFCGTAWIALADRAASLRNLPGVLLALAAVGVSLHHLLTDRLHPWVR